MKTLFLFVSLLLGLLLIGACEEQIDESQICVSNLTCGDQSTCVDGRCVSYQVNTSKDAYTLFKEEFHYRLINDCGSCHAVAEEINNTTATDEQSPYYIEKQPIESEYSWRIYTKNLTEEKIRKSYEETVNEFIGEEDPEETSIMVYGRGEFDLRTSDADGNPVAHPRVYQRSIYDKNGNLLYVTNIGYQRTIEWIKIWMTQKGLTYKTNTDNPMVDPPMGGTGGNTMAGNTTAGNTTAGNTTAGNTTTAGESGSMAGTPGGMPIEEGATMAGTTNPTQPTGNRLDAQYFADNMLDNYKSQCLGCHRRNNDFVFVPNAEDIADLQAKIDSAIKPRINFANVDESDFFKQLDSEQTKRDHNKPSVKKEEFKQQVRDWVNASR